jgi:hypothetical protein
VRLIATDKIKAPQRNPSDIRRTELADQDSRIYPAAVTENAGSPLLKDAPD